ncbi:Cof subfamily protein (haloacid dehalogenase superfamily) [Microbacterium terrae]|uniref:Sugar phosphatase YidA n=1 Tax=Microbacterium terrae TaxID=69369 RepID=A0A0M2HI81_9MICO|nr:HAD family hydrolase [Microbacterium terrae]KJL44028.1 Sugar phosphatase YidA [Microbacterium terrae]MBP1079437.1 Cof subfamily protein (haloacid dehalogenase superfamily) [Microbacterium terrae]GLJ98837.1 haloacid dehalogenase [Microbacterium terrae]
MSEAHLPPTGSIKVVKPAKAAKLVEQVARDTEEAPAVVERLLIVLDIDGTVLLEDESLSPGVVEAVEHAHRTGHEVMIATGRSWEGTHEILRALQIAPEFVVCSNGAVVLKRIDATDLSYERWHVETFDPAEVLTLLKEHLPDARYLVELPDGHRLFTEHLDDWNLTRADRVPFEELAKAPVCRVVVVAPEKGEGDFVELVSRIGLHQVSYAVGWTAWLDIAPLGVDKSTGLERVRTELGIDPAHVLVIGDGRNDLGMFAWARQNGGRAVAMKQGPQEVRDAATEVTASVHEGGVAAVLRSL